MKKTLAFLCIMVCSSTMTWAQQAKLVRPVLDLTPQITIEPINGNGNDNGNENGNGKRNENVEVVLEKPVIRSTHNSITFLVDENLPAYEPDLLSSTKFNLSSDQMAEMVAKGAKELHPKEGFIASSFEKDSLLYFGNDVLFQTIVRSFAEHRPLVLTPDMVWLVIAQGFSQHVNDNAEALRSKLVKHDGQVTLMVRTKEDLLTGHPDWEGLMTDFERQIAANTQGDIAITITSDFTTTGPIERIASQVTLMSAMQHYFEYMVFYLSCGIPDITLQGTPDDWQKVYDKAMSLKGYNLEWWTKDLAPILKEFVRASEGHPRQSFWQDMVMKKAPDVINRGSCGMGQTEVDGWFLKLFPYDKDGVRIGSKVKYNKEMLSEMVKVPVRYVVAQPDGTTQETDLSLFAGFVGVKEDTTTRVLMPQMGWMVRKAEDPNGRNEALRHGLALRVKEVPEGLRGTKSINNLTLFFVDRVRLPQWMEDIDITTFIVHGKVTKKEAKALKKRFPNIRLDNPSKK